MSELLESSLPYPTLHCEVHDLSNKMEEIRKELLGSNSV